MFPKLLVILDHKGFIKAFTGLYESSVQGFQTDQSVLGGLTIAAGFGV